MPPGMDIVKEKKPCTVTGGGKAEGAYMDVNN